MSENSPKSELKSRPFTAGALFVCRALAQADGGFIVHVQENDRNGFVETDDDIWPGDEFVAVFKEFQDDKPVFEHVYARTKKKSFDDAIGDETIWDGWRRSTDDLSDSKYTPGQTLACTVIEPHDGGYFILIGHKTTRGFLRSDALYYVGEEIFAQFVCVHNGCILLAPVLESTRTIRPKSGDKVMCTVVEHWHQGYKVILAETGQEGYFETSEVLKAGEQFSAEYVGMWRGLALVNTTRQTAKES